MFNKVYLYYFSGTGNAQNLAHWIFENFKQNNFEVEINKIEKCNLPKPNQNRRPLIGIISAAYGFNIQPLIFYFILKFPRLKNSSFFIVNTKVGLKLSH